MTQNPYAPPSVAAERQAPATIGEQQFVLADPGRRIFAKLLDTVVLVAAFGPCILAGELLLMKALAGLLLVLPPIMLILQWGLISATGQSLGKRWMGLRIITYEGARAGFVRGVVLREWVMKLGSAALYGFPLLLDPLFGLGKSRQCLHDHLALTLVIEADSTESTRDASAPRHASA